MNRDRLPEEQPQPPSPGPAEKEEGAAVQWDGSEAEMVPDEDAEEYEDDYAAVKLTYTLSDQEWYRALLAQKLPKKRGICLWAVRVLLLAGAFALFAAFLRLSQPAFLAAGILCLAAEVATILPYAWLLWQAGKRQDYLPYTLKIYPDEIEVSHGRDAYTVPLDESRVREEKYGLLLIYRAQTYIEKGAVLVLPLRSVEPGMLADVEAIVRAGTNRRKP